VGAIGAFSVAETALAAPYSSAAVAPVLGLLAAEGEGQVSAA